MLEVSEESIVAKFVPAMVDFKAITEALTS
jgi:hypothetical protein